MRGRGRGIDLRQVMAIFLTLSMFGMLGNMIKRDHFDHLQIAVAVLVARELGATLMLPDIKGRKPGDKRKFIEIYDAEEFANRLNGVIKVARNQWALASSRKLAIVKEVGEFLTKIGISTETPIYVTRSRWHKNLKPLKDIFPKTYAKEFLMPPDKKEMFVSSASCELEKVMDFHLASESDIFVPASADLFYATVAGSRIASGRTRILVPTSTSSLSHISPYISEKKHNAYSCFCLFPRKSRFSS